MIFTVLRCIVLYALVAALAGCAALLPKSKAETDAVWQSFDEARLAIEKIEPYKTTRDDLRQLGIGTVGDPTITLLSHVDIAVRFPIGGVLRERDVDPGIRDCLRAGKACSAYQVNVRRTNRDRTGDFWLTRRPIGNGGLFRPGSLWSRWPRVIHGRCLPRKMNLPA